MTGRCDEGKRSMDYLSTEAQGSNASAEGADRRQAQRFTSLIRAAKLADDSGEFVCVIRDVSETGIGLRTFHELPAGDPLTLILQNGQSYALKRVRDNGTDGSFTFDAPVNVETLIVEASKFPKRQLRIDLQVAVKISTLTQSFNATITNLSQQGARFECDSMFAIEQPVRLQINRMPELRAKIRWRRDEEYGIAFDTTFTLREFAQHIAALQNPSLLRD